MGEVPPIFSGFHDFRTRNLDFLNKKDLRRKFQAPERKTS